MHEPLNDIKILPRSFYARDTVLVAKALLGKLLVRKIGNEILSGIIVETESYIHDDPASHSYIGKTERNQAMFGEVGRAYVYFIYGTHYCVNAVARNKKTEAGAVLIRALQSVEGIEVMAERRKTENLKNLTNGPGKLAQALAITKNQYGIDLTNPGELYIAEGLTRTPRIQAAPRVGIKKGLDRMWNFKIEISTRSLV